VLDEDPKGIDRDILSEIAVGSSVIDRKGVVHTVNEVLPDGKLRITSEYPTGPRINKLSVSGFRRIGNASATGDDKISNPNLQPALKENVPIPALGHRSVEFSDTYLLDSTYRRLSAVEAAYVVEQWDHENGFPSPFARREAREKTERTIKRHEIWHMVAVAVIFALFIWINELTRTIDQRADDSEILNHLREQSKDDPRLNSAISSADKWDQEQYDTANDH
jgi:hypothetical protein